MLNPNETPTDITLSGANLNKSIKNNTFIAKVKSIDADLTDIHLHTFTTSSTISNDNAAFVLRNDSLFSSETYNFVQKGEYVITIKTDDGKFNGIFQKDITILNPNFKATDITLSGANLNKSIKNNTFIAKVKSIDADLTDIHLHTFTTSSTISNDNAAFVLRNDSLFSSETYNFVQKGEYIITIKTDDGKFNGIFQKDITILNPNETPTDILLENLKLREGNLPNTFIAILKSTDLDVEDKHIYTFVNGEGSADNQDFTIKGDSLFSNITFDFESKKLYSIRLKTNDSRFNGTFEKVIILDILDYTPSKVDADNIISPTPPDGINDVWVIRNIQDFPNSKLSIFNEAGILVYSTTKYENNWDGTSNGSELPSSTYYYVLSSVEGDFTGFISIIRR
ncbi:MAG: gliding motility-associated C-terminal domain-containing protein [Cytophagales bacterium]|nr:MAG: gliding motility-associated C-terminal domain-containing protein [Cytophagales bacterium]